MEKYLEAFRNPSNHTNMFKYIIKDMSKNFF